MDDRKAMRQALREYFIADGTDEGLEASVRAVDPLFGLKEEDQDRFIAWLPKDERKTLRMAMKYAARLQDKLGF